MRTESYRTQQTGGGGREGTLVVFQETEGGEELISNFQESNQGEVLKL